MSTDIRRHLWMNITAWGVVFVFAFEQAAWAGEGGEGRGTPEVRQQQEVILTSQPAEVLRAVEHKAKEAIGHRNEIEGARGVVQGIVGPEEAKEKMLEPSISVIEPKEEKGMDYLKNQGLHYDRSPFEAMRNLLTRRGQAAPDIERIGAPLILSDIPAGVLTENTRGELKDKTWKEAESVAKEVAARAAAEEAAAEARKWARLKAEAEAKRAAEKAAVEKLAAKKAAAEARKGAQLKAEAEAKRKAAEAEVEAKKKAAAEKMAVEKLAAEETAAEARKGAQLKAEAEAKRAAEKAAAEKMAVEKLAAKKAAAEARKGAQLKAEAEAKRATEKAAAEKMEVEKMAVEKLEAEEAAAEARKGAERVAKEAAARAAEEAAIVARHRGEGIWDKKSRNLKSVLMMDYSPSVGNQMPISIKIGTHVSKLNSDYRRHYSFEIPFSESSLRSSEATKAIRPEWSLRGQSPKQSHRLLRPFGARYDSYGMGEWIIPIGISYRMRSLATTLWKAPSNIAWKPMWLLRALNYLKESAERKVQSYVRLFAMGMKESLRRLTNKPIFLKRL